MNYSINSRKVSNFSVLVFYLNDLFYMFINFGNLNLFAIILAYFLYIVINLIWYSDYFFGKKRRLLKQISKEEMSEIKQKFGLINIGSFVSTIITSILVSSTLAESLLDGLLLGLLLGFLVLSYLFNLIVYDKSQNLTNRLLVLFIDSGPILINFCLQSLILIFWK